jgi:acetylornithine deacetylase/succinyl-diaminopimelate desuccinylase-like protein
MSRQEAIAIATGLFDDGRFERDLARRVAIPTESQNPARRPELTRYLEDEMVPALAAMGFETAIVGDAAAVDGGLPFLIAERIEDPGRPTLLAYGHGDVIRGLDQDWDAGLSPWTMTERDGAWWGRGVADNKGQHSIALAAMAAVLKARGRLGFNAKWLIEMGEERGSPGLRAVAEAHRDRLAADLFVGSDGPRLARDLPTIFLGARGCATFDLEIRARAGGHHSGNWGGLLSDPAIRLAHAVATIADARGRIAIREWLPGELPPAVRRALANCAIVPGPRDPAIDPDWGEPGLTAAEKVYGWSSFDVLAFESGNPATPVNAVPPRAWARCQLRFPVGVAEDDILPALRRHLARAGFDDVAVTPVDEIFRATRLDPDDPWVGWAAASIERTLGARPVILPNLGGALPNDVFADLLGLPTVWVPHSYPGCSQHAPNEHLPVSIVREGLAMMAGLYFDLGEAPAAMLSSGSRAARP